MVSVERVHGSGAPGPRTVNFAILDTILFSSRRLDVRPCASLLPKITVRVVVLRLILFKNAVTLQLELEITARKIQRGLPDPGRSICLG